jgi:hypothetical protein
VAPTSRSADEILAQVQAGGDAAAQSVPSDTAEPAAPRGRGAVTFH